MGAGPAGVEKTVLPRDWAAPGSGLSSSLAKPRASASGTGGKQRPGGAWRTAGALPVPRESRTEPAHIWNLWHRSVAAGGSAGGATPAGQRCDRPYPGESVTVLLLRRLRSQGEEAAGGTPGAKGPPSPDPLGLPRLQPFPAVSARATQSLLGIGSWKQALGEAGRRAGQRRCCPVLGALGA